MADIRAEDFWSPGPLFTGVRGIGLLGSSSFKDMQMGASLQKEKSPASLTVYSLVLLRDWHREAKVTDEGPGVWLAPRGLSLTFLFSY